MDAPNQNSHAYPGRAFQQPAEALAKRAPPDPDRTGGRCQCVRPASVLSGNRPLAAEPRDGAVARQRARSAARGEERPACRGGLRAALRRQGAGGRKSAAGAAGAGFHSAAAGAVSGDRRSTGTGMFASAIRRRRACSSRFAIHTRWKTGLRTTPCTSFFIQRACGSSSLNWDEFARPVDPDPASRCRARQPGGGAIAR